MRRLVKIEFIEGVGVLKSNLLLLSKLLVPRFHAVFHVELVYFKARGAHFREIVWSFIL